MYLTYNEYLAMNGTLSETAFIDLEYEARMYIDLVTYNRLKNEIEIPEAVKEAMYHLIKVIQVKQAAMNIPSGDEEVDSQSVAIASQSNDGVSVSYNILSARDIIETSQKEIDDMLNRYLQGIRNSLGHRLLYKGIYPDEVVA